MSVRANVAMLMAVASLLQGCVVYEPVPIAQPTTQQRFDRSWAAAAGAMADQGVTITQQDRGAGVIRGMRGSALLTAEVQTLADGRIQVKFNAVTADKADPGIVQRLSDSYDRRMGR